MEPFLKEYLGLLKLEKNLSDNSVESYRSDLEKFLNFVSSSGINDLSEIDSKLISKFFQQQKKEDISSSTAARYLSSLRGFFGYLHSNDYIKDDPTDKVSSSKRSRTLPEVLTVDEIDRILDQPNIKENLGMRDKAILELFYSSGLRVISIKFFTDLLVCDTIPSNN